MIERIRRADAQDAGELGRLEAEARAAASGQRGGMRHLEEHPPVGEWGDHVARLDVRVWLAVIDDVPMGFLDLRLEGRLAQVRQVWVDPGARELGLGDLLLAAAMDAARSHGCAVLEGTALPGDRDTKNLYERAGIVARKIVLSVALRPDGQ